MNKLVLRSISNKKWLGNGNKLIGLRSGYRQLHGTATVLNDQKPKVEKIIIEPHPKVGGGEPVVIKSGQPPIIPPVEPEVKPVGAIPEPEPESPKKKFSFTWFIIKYGFYASLVYGGLLFTATKNETVMDFVIDKQLPYYEEIIDIMENGSVDDLTTKWTELTNKFKNLKLPSQDDINHITNKGEKFFEDTKNKLSPSVSPESKDATPAQQLQKPVATVHKAVASLPLINFKSSSKSSPVEDSVKATIDSFNDLIKSIDVSTANTTGKDGLIKVINDNVGKLTQKIEALTKNFDETVQLQLKDSQTELLSSYTKKELELTENLLDQFNHEKSQLEEKLNARLINEINATKETISQAAVNAVSMMRIEQTKKFEALVKETIDKERNGRLANLEKLNDRLTELEEFSTSLEHQLTSNHNKSVLTKSIANLKHVLFSTTEISDGEQSKLLIKYFEKIDNVSKSINDELISLTIQDLKPLLTNNESILSIRQLLNKWDQLTPELRSASLLPPNAGLLGHFASIIFSKLLLPVKGSKPQGKDIESVIGRIESSLSRGELDLAVEEAANLKGWPRKLADDWVKEGRKRLEVQFLIDILESESRIV